MEDWLGREQCSIEEVENAKKYCPLYSNSFVETIQRKEGKGSKLANIHLLHHFVDNIINFGHADNGFVELVNTTWNQMSRILLEEQGIKMIKNTIN